MNDLSLTEYDKVLYDSQPIERTHPSDLAPLGRLFGINTVPLSSAKVLELGCGSGHNLFGLAAAYPEAEFVGVDLAKVQIERGKDLAAKAGLSNLKLIHLSITDITPDFGKFDYIICHGLYSWVPPEVRRAILSVFNQNAAQSAVSYLSYNTYPGWHTRETIREIMLFAAKNLSTPEERAAAGRRALSFLAQAETELKKYDQLFLREVKTILNLPDWYLHHDILAEINQPFYFSEILEQAQVNNLQYLGDGELPKIWAQDIPVRIQKTLDKLANNLGSREQLLDFLRNTMFRRSLFVNKEIRLERNLSTKKLLSLYLLSRSVPENLTGRLSSEEEMVFKNPNGGALKTAVPLVKSALLQLAEAYPQALSFAELSERAQKRLRAEEPDYQSAKQEDIVQLAATLLRAYTADLIKLRVEPARAVSEAGDYPKASSLSRAEAQSLESVTNLQNERVSLAENERKLLVLLDGKTPRTKLLSAAVPGCEDETSLDLALSSLAKRALILA